MRCVTGFDAHREDWRGYTATPWGRIRYAVVGHVLADHLAGRPGSRVLDVGGADGLDALPLLRAGHDVTVLDPAPRLLADAAAVGLATRAAGIDDLADPALADLVPADVVLCHYVLQYRPDETADLRALAAALRPGGLLSVVLPNPAHRVLTSFLREGPAAALAELERHTAKTVTFGSQMRKIALPDLERAVVGAGLEVLEVYGGRIVGDLMVDNEVKHDPAFYRDWERLELALARREPYARLGQFYGVIARRPVG